MIFSWRRAALLAVLAFFALFLPRFFMAPQLWDGGRD